MRKIRINIRNKIRKFAVKAIALSIVGVIVMFAIFHFSNSTQAAWFDDSYQYRKAIPLTNGTSAQTNVKYNVTLDTSTLISAGKMQSSCADMRFTMPDGTLLRYYLASGCNTTTTSVWLDFYTMPAGTFNVYFYYGNPSAVSDSVPTQFSDATASSTSTGTIASEEKTNSPFAYWKFDEGVGATAYNSGTGKTAMNANLSTGASAPTWQTEDKCISGKCLYFGTSKVSFSTSGIQSATSLTVSAWIKTPGGSGSNNAIELNPGASGEVRIFSADNWSSIETNSPGDIGVNVSLPSNFKNNWHLITKTYDSSTIKTYLDGRLIGNVSYSTTPTIGSTGYIGTDNAGNYYKGFIDDVKIYNYVRTAAQIKEDYNVKASALAKGAGTALGANSKNGDFLSQGLVGYWNMDEGTGTTANDYSGNGNTGTLGSGTSAPTWTSSGKFGRALSFDGSNDYVSAADSSSLQVSSANSLSLFTWVKTSTTGDATLVSKYGDPIVDNYSLFLSFGVLCGRLIDLSGNGFTNHCMYSGTVNDNVWHHVGFVYNRGSQTLTFYLDGVAKDVYSNLNITGTIASTGTLEIGDETTPGHQNFFPGTLDDIRMYNRVLSPAEVMQLYNWAPGPVVRYDYSEGVGTTVYDKSTNNNNGTWHGSGSKHYVVSPNGTGNAGNFNGIDDYIETPDFSLTSNRTFSAWFNASTVPASGNKVIFAKRTSMTGSSGTTDEWYLYISNQNLVGVLNYGAGGASTLRATGATTISPNKWYFVSLTYDGSAVKVYLNGVLDGSTSGSVTVNDGDAPYHIGDDGDSTRFFKGQIDQVKIYNYGRTQKQVVEDMTSGHSVNTLGGSTSGPVGYWKFDEGVGLTAYNSGSGGTSLNGTLTNMATGSTASGWTSYGKFGRALAFDGTNDYVALTDSADLSPGTGDMTISAWVKTSVNDSAEHWIYSDYGSSQNALVLLRYYTNDKFQIYFRDTGGSNSISVSSLSTPTIGQWYHVVGIKSGTTAYLYVNGVLQGSNTNSSLGSVTTNDANAPNIGSFLAVNSYWKGSIDEVKIYPYALNATDVKQDYSHGAGIALGALSTASDGKTPDNSMNRAYCVPGDTYTCSAPIAEWNFEEGSGTTVNDTSGNGNNGTWNGTGSLHYRISTKGTGNAGNFNGINDYVDLGQDSAIEPTSSLSVGAWIYRTGNLDNFSGIVSSRKNGSNDGGYILVGTSSNTVRFYIKRDASTWIEAESSTIPLNQWVYVMGVWDGNSLFMYVNGSLQSAAGSATSIYYGGVNVQNAYIGLYGASGAARYWVGRIDNIRIYNYARSAAQVAWDYNRGGPVGRWKLDECQGTSAYDASGNGNTGTINIGGSGTQTTAGLCNDGSTASAWYNGANGKFNSSLNFDATDDSVRIPTSSVFDFTGDVTLSAWIKRNDINHRGEIVSRGISGHDIWEFAIDDASYNGKLIFYAEGQSGRLFVVSNKTIFDQNWHLVTVKRENNVITFFIDGQATTSTVDPNGNGYTYAGAFQTGYEVNIGSYAGTGTYFSGQIDDVRIYSYALNTFQIRNMLTDGATVRFAPVTGTP